MPQTASARWRQVMSVVARATAASLLAMGCAASATEAPSDRPNPSAGGGGASSAGANNNAGAPAVSGAGNASGATSAGSSAGGASAGGAHAGAGGAPISGGTAGSSSSGGKCNTAGPTGEVFLDNFEDGEFSACPSWIDADPTLGGMWSVKADGETKVLAQNAPVSDWVIAVSGSYKWTDQTVTAKVKYSSSPGEIGIFARVQDLRNYYFLYLDGSNIVLRGRVDNSQLTSVKVKKPTVEGTWYTLKLSVIGSTLTGYLDGVQLVTTTDTGVKGGGVGVGIGDSATGEFDDVTVTTP
jgi:Concanavalin A-like lectin/glucanases superfamily